MSVRRGTDLLDRIGLELPVVQAGMAGGVAGGRLAGEVSRAGALGTVGMAAPRAFAAALADARRRAPSRPVAANLLVPFLRSAHLDACIASGVSLVVLHGGLAPRALAALRRARVPVLVSVGTAGQTRRALAAGADGLVVQGVEAGGHLVGVDPLEVALPAVLEVAQDAPVLAAGGVATADDVRRLLRQGATAVIAGTRFLLTEESAAHPEYQRRVLGADRTIRTMLFGIGWPMPHRVVPNAATDAWCARTELGPAWVRGVARISSPLGRIVPLGALGATAAVQRATVPLFTPALPLAGMPADLVHRSALYAGETLHRIDAVVPAGQAVAELTP